MIKARCPGSCGELIQGLIYGGEKLISYPINCYSYVTLREGRKRKNQCTKAYAMVERVFEHYGLNKEYSKDIAINIHSEIPIGKGMASSTADLAATVVATAKYLGKFITEEELAKLCIDIEPTDSTVFREITLFDHMNGGFIKGYGAMPNCKVLLLEGKETIDTVDFHKLDFRDKLKENEENLKKALKLFEKGMEKRDIYSIGKGASISALANQSIIYKEGLEKLCELSYRLGAAGVNVAHSGSVIGIIYEDNKFDKEMFLNRINEDKLMDNYEGVRDYNIVLGGATLL